MQTDQITIFTFLHLFESLFAATTTTNSDKNNNNNNNNRICANNIDLKGVRSGINNGALPLL